MKKEEIEIALRKPAIKFEIDGFKPIESNSASWIGKVLLCSKGEKWPNSNGKPMIPICQINIAELPNKEEYLDDIELLTLFLDAEEIPMDSPNGEGWLLRTYSKIDELVEIEKPEINSTVKPFQLKSKSIENDFPCWEDCPIEIPEEFDEDYYDLFPNQNGFKIGGWPTLVQSEIYWAPFNEHPANPKYVFQIDSSEKANLYWGDNGVAYFGRGTKDGLKDEWSFSWQCY